VFPKLKRQRVNLTVQRIASLSCAPGAREAYLWDAAVAGFGVRAYPNGRKTYFVTYRSDGGGRKAPQRKLALGDVDSISLADARKVAKQRLGEVAAGGDPSGARHEARRRERALLSAALDRYEQSLARRRIVKRKEAMSLLHREMLGPLGNVDLAELDRPTLVARIAEVEDGGRPGTAVDLRGKMVVFLSWAVNEGLIAASPLAGWRRERRTRAERLKQPGRALADWEIPILWSAAGAAGWPFGPYLQLLLLLGQRRTETALMAWHNIDLAAGEWVIPAAVTKSGREHRVPLPPAAVQIIRQRPRMAGTNLVFPGRGGRPMNGWGARLRPVLEVTAKANMANWSLHDLRRTMRTGLGALDVDPIIAELMLNHALQGDLAKAYDRHDYWRRRVEAVNRWADHVMALAESSGGAAVVPLRAAR
jgi:integrase